MEIKLDGAWAMVDAWVKYAKSWMWWIVDVVMVFVLFCLVLSGVKDLLMIGPWVPEMGQPLWWLYVAGALYLVKKAG